MRKTIEVRGVEGLGNRIFTLAFALNLAQRQQRIVIVDWSDGGIGPSGVDLFGDYFDVEEIEVRTCTTGMNAKVEYRPIQVAKKIREFKFVKRIYRRMTFGSTVWVAKSPIHIFRRRIILPIDLQNPYRKKLICLEYQPWRLLPHEVRQIQLRDHFKREAEQLMPNIQSMLGVHVRFSDKKPTSSLEDLCAMLKEREEQIFLATDSLVVKEYLSAEIPNIACIPQRLHDGKSRGGLHHTKTLDDEKLLLFKNSLFDAYLLSQSKFFYGQSNSSYSLLVDAWRNGEDSAFWC